MAQHKSTYAGIYGVVRRIPAGKVATYGQVGSLAESGPRQVGYALAALKDDGVPWHRVINAKGEISLRRGKELQRVLLEQEGVQFSEAGRVDLAVFGWIFPSGCSQLGE
jgi:alkylated DNA nucleotide flippase Atl1